MSTIDGVEFNEKLTKTKEVILDLIEFMDSYNEEFGEHMPEDMTNRMATLHIDLSEAYLAIDVLKKHHEWS